MLKYNSYESFELGYYYGRQPLSKEFSDREIEFIFPGVKPESFYNGLIDGLSHDNFRIKKIRELKLI